MRFYLGTHLVNWLWKVTIPLFVSERRLRSHAKLYRARCDWALDSGGFSELSMYGRWTHGPQSYATNVAVYIQCIGRLQWAAVQDWMCEPHILEKTGLSVRSHQMKTIESYHVLHDLAPSIPWVPVIQGWNLRDYHNHVELYDKHAIQLDQMPAVGVGSICRRQRTREGVEILRSLMRYHLPLHGFGVKKTALLQLPDAVVSTDSMAWSFAARYDKPLKGHTHKNCANCLEYALRWRRTLLNTLECKETENVEVHAK